MTRGAGMRTIEIPCINIRQRIGDYYVGTINHTDLIDITTVDVRQIAEKRDGIYSYTGIQRQLNKSRAKRIGEYTNTLDACFPTAVVLSVDGRCVTYDENKKTLALTEDEGDPNNDIEPIPFNSLARVIDGQHRIEGLKLYKQEEPFELNVAIFVDIDPSVEGYIFSTVNLHQSKVNSSLAYDLFALSKKRSPQKLCHQIAVALDGMDNSPFHNKIKRLGKAEAHNIPASISQASFVKSLLKYISADPMKDRDAYLNDKQPENYDDSRKVRFIFRDFLVEEKDVELTNILNNYFSAARTRWNQAWNNPDKGIMLSRTNGFQGLMRVLKPAYLSLNKTVPSEQDFLNIFNKASITDDDFTTERYPPGSSGEVKLARELIEQCDLV